MIFWAKAGGIAMAVASATAGAVWSASEYVHNRWALKEDVQAVEEHTIIAGTKADYALDLQMQSLIAQIAYLERKPKKSRDEMEQLKYLRGQLENMRKIRAGKK